MSSRPRPTSQLPRAPVELDAESIVDGKATLTGIHTITVGPSAVIHPFARVVSTYGAVRIGQGSIVSERSTIGHGDGGEQPPDTDTLPSLDVALGRDVMVEPGAQVAALEVGDGSIVGMGARVGPGAVLGRHCRVAPGCVVRPGDLLPDYTVVYADGRKRLHRPGLENLRAIAHDRQLDALKRLIKSDLAKHSSPAS